MNEFMQSAALAPYKLLLSRIIRFKPYTLSDKEERVLAMQTEMAEASGQIFRQLNDTDLKFGTVKDEKGQPLELSHATFTSCLFSPSRDVRANAFHTYYKQYAGHAHTFAASLAGSINRGRVLCEGPQLQVDLGIGPVS